MNEVSHEQIYERLIAVEAKVDEIDKNTKDLVEAIDAAKGAIKVLGWIASIAQPILWIGGEFSAGGFFHGEFGGGGTSSNTAYLRTRSSTNATINQFIGVRTSDAFTVYAGGGGSAYYNDGCYEFTTTGGRSVWGGAGGGSAGGGSVRGSPGTSINGGNGGAGGTTGTAGTAPAGGGGASYSSGSSGAGAAGQVIITVFPA